MSSMKGITTGEGTLQPRLPSGHCVRAGAVAHVHCRRKRARADQKWARAEQKWAGSAGVGWLSGPGLRRSELAEAEVGQS